MKWTPDDVIGLVLASTIPLLAILVVGGANEVQLIVEEWRKKHKHERAE